MSWSTCSEAHGEGDDERQCFGERSTIRAWDGPGRRLPSFAQDLTAAVHCHAGSRYLAQHLRNPRRRPPSANSGKAEKLLIEHGLKPRVSHARSPESQYLSDDASAKEQNRVSTALSRPVKSNHYLHDDRALFHVAGVTTKMGNCATWQNRLPQLIFGGQHCP